MSKYLDVILVAVICGAFLAQCAVMRIRYVAKPDASQIAIRTVQLIKINPDDAFDSSSPMLKTGATDGGE